MAKHGLLDGKRWPFAWQFATFFLILGGDVGVQIMSVGVHTRYEGGENGIDINVLHLKERQVVHLEQPARNKRKEIGHSVVEQQEYERIGHQTDVRTGREDKTAVDDTAVKYGQLNEKEDADKGYGRVEEIGQRRISSRIELTHLAVGSDVKQHVQRIRDKCEQQAASECVEPELHTYILPLFD